MALRYSRLVVRPGSRRAFFPITMYPPFFGYIDYEATTAFEKPYGYIYYESMRWQATRKFFLALMDYRFYIPAKSDYK